MLLEVVPGCKAHLVVGAGETEAGERRIVNNGRKEKCMLHARYEQSYAKGKVNTLESQGVI